MNVYCLGMGVIHNGYVVCGYVYGVSITQLGYIGVMIQCGMGYDKGMCMV